MALIVKTQEVADFYEVSERTIRKWEDKGCPKKGHGNWDLKAVNAWWLENIFSLKNDGDDIKNVQLEYWRAKTRSENVKANIAEERVMAKESFVKAWTWRVNELANGLRSWVMRLSPLLAMKQETEVRSIIDGEVWKLLDKFSRTGKFTPSSEGQSAGSRGRGDA